MATFAQKPGTAVAIATIGAVFGALAMTCYHLNGRQLDRIEADLASRKASTPT